MTIGKSFPRATIWDQPRFFNPFGLEVTAFPRYTTVWWLLDLGHSDLFTLVGYSFVRRNLNVKNQITVGKKFSRATKWDHPRFFIFFGLEVTAFPRFITVWWLLDLGHSDLFTLVGFSFVRKNLNIKNQMTVAKRFLRATKWDHPQFFYLFWLKSYGLSKVHYCMVVVGFGTFRHFHFGWL